MLETGRILPLKILTKQPPREEKTAGGIIIPLTDKPKTIVGEVVLVGDIPATSPFKDFKIKVGDKVLHSPHSFVEVEIEKELFRLVNFQDILFLF